MMTEGSGSWRPKNTWIQWIRIRNTGFCIFGTLYGDNSQYHTVVTVLQRRNDGKFRHKEGMTQDERLPGAEAILKGPKHDQVGCEFFLHKADPYG
jgi:hypothetical protein